VKISNLLIKGGKPHHLRSMEPSDAARGPPPRQGPATRALGERGRFRASDIDNQYI